MSQTVLTIPCFNEASRFAPAAFEALTRELSLLFVDDGSTDDTAAILARFCEDVGPDRARLLCLEKNVGKGEAVRRGLEAAAAEGAAMTGYADADLATPPEELIRLASELRDGSATVVLGSRVAHLGAQVERGAMRHYLGRVFATGASWILRARVYDTQCGAKFFEVTQGFSRAIATPFASRWAFDVELIGRLLIEGEEIVEVPLRRWQDVPGSKLRVTSMVRAGVELGSIARALGRYAKQ